MEGVAGECRSTNGGWECVGGVAGLWCSGGAGGMRHTVASPRGATLAGTRLVTQVSHNVRCHVCPRLQRSPIIYQVCLPSDALPARCIRQPAATHSVYAAHPLAHTRVTRYSTRHSHPKSWWLSPPFPSHRPTYPHNHHLHGSAAVGACAAQALLSLPQTSCASTCMRPPCAPSRAAIPTTPHTPATASTPTPRHVARVYVSRPHNPPCLLPHPPCPRRVSLDITRSPAFFQALSHQALRACGASYSCSRAYTNAVDSKANQ